MADELTMEPLIETLRKKGDARNSTAWANGDPDYVAEYSLTPDHIPALITLATQWIDEPSENEAVFGPVHAWRALAQLRAVQAVQPLLDVQDELDEREDDWYLEEFHDVFGLIGPAAIPPLAAYLADDSHGQFPRTSAANGLREIARRFPETRDEVVARLTAELARHQSDASDLNGSLVGDLLDLQAVESAETIERAFAANVIDPTIAGDWGDVRDELDVPGLGIAPDRTPGWLSLRERFGMTKVDDEPRQRAAERKPSGAAKRQLRAKRKAERKNRKRNRKPR
jgi:hypothetical protein